MICLKTALISVCTVIVNGGKKQNSRTEDNDNTNFVGHIQYKNNKVYTHVCAYL